MEHEHDHPQAPPKRPAASSRPAPSAHDPAHKDHAADPNDNALRLNREAERWRRQAVREQARAAGEPEPAFGPLAEAPDLYSLQARRARLLRQFERERADRADWAATEEGRAAAAVALDRAEARRAAEEAEVRERETAWRARVAEVAAALSEHVYPDAAPWTEGRPAPSADEQATTGPGEQVGATVPAPPPLLSTPDSLPAPHISVEAPHAAHAAQQAPYADALPPLVPPAAAPLPAAPDPAAHLTAHGGSAPIPAAAATPSGLAPLVIPSTSRQIEALRARGEGVPLDPRVAQGLAARLGVDPAVLAPVRLHNGPDAWALAQRLGQPVCAEGDDIFFQKGAYDLTTVRGRNLLGRQLARTTAVIQAAQRLRAASAVPLDSAREAAAAHAPVTAAAPVTRKGATGAAASGPAPPNTTHPLPTFGWVSLGDAPNDGGLNLRPQPSTDAWSKTPQKIADLTKLIVDRQTAQRWSHVTLTDGRSGWVDSQFVDTRWPEPDAQLHRVVAGDSAFSLAHQYYEQDARLIQGIDKRFFINVLAYVNPHLNIHDLRTSPAEYLWIPSARFAFSLADRLSHGSLTGGAWADLSGAWNGAWSAAEGAAAAVWTYVEGNVAFDVGLIEGAFNAVWGTLTGLAGLAKLPFDLVVGLVRDLITGTLVGKAQELWDAVTHLDPGRLVGAAGTLLGLALTDFAAKWNDPDLIKKWTLSIGDFFYCIITEEVSEVVGPTA